MLAEAKRGRLRRLPHGVIPTEPVRTDPRGLSAPKALARTRLAGEPRVRNPVEITSTPDVTSYTLAIDDLRQAASVARLIADEDPDLRLARRIGVIGQEAAIAEANARPAATALGYFSIRLVLESGLIVTYARPFTEGRGSGFPIDVKRFVPADKLDFHRSLIALRNKVYAHVDASVPQGFERRVRYEARPDGGESDEIQSPRLLGEDELRDMADLADQIIERLEAARR